VRYPNIERFVNAGWGLHVDPFEKKFHAWVGTKRAGHNYIGISVDDALAHLEHYLGDKGVGHINERITES
jgi:hypothetical protein